MRRPPVDSPPRTDGDRGHRVVISSRHRRRASLACAALAAAGFAATPVPAASATDHATVALWRLNEPAGATVMKDSSPSRHTGKIGGAIETGFTSGGATAYHWRFTKPNEPPPKPERLVVVKDADQLDPRRGYYSVTIRYRTTHSFGNVIQKGQHGSSGGYWKIQQPHGIAQCFFSGPKGTIGATSGTPLNDGEWHVVRCERSAHGLTMTVDGLVVSTKQGSTGPIDNARPLSIGGKLNCDQEDVTCDYFVGDIDRVRIAT